MIEDDTNPSTSGGRGGWGAVCPISIDLTKRGDLALVHRAVVNGWDVAEVVREQITSQLGSALAAAGDDPRRILRVAKLMLAMEATNLVIEGVPLSRVQPRLRRRRREQRRPQPLRAPVGQSDSLAN
jgi:hypothetical protein